MKKLFLIIFVGFVVYIAAGVSDEMNRQEKERNAMLRDTFKYSVLRKTTDQVILAVGKPSTTQQAGGTEYWNYHYATKDPITGKLDHNAQMVIENGYVRDVNF
ncbi:MAG: hypothetical protein ACXV74_00400 [Methylobacter sp.]